VTSWMPLTSPTFQSCFGLSGCVLWQNKNSIVKSRCYGEGAPKNAPLSRLQDFAPLGTPTSATVRGTKRIYQWWHN
jgi:hypothetical protein